MKDTEILNHIRDSLRSHSERLLPISPAQSQSMAGTIETLRGYERRLDDMAQYFTPPGSWCIPDFKPVRPPFQHFWRCNHHPSCFENYYGRESAMMHDGEMIPAVIVQRHCEHGCDKNELRWHDNGCRPQTS